MIRLVFAVAFLVASAASGPASAQGVADFYRGKSVDIIVGHAPGGGYDQAARVLARHMGKHLPGNPSFAVRNMPGAGSVLAANHVNNVAPEDGTVIGIYADILPVAKLLDIQGVQFDPKTFGWLGSVASRGYPVLVIRSDAPATTLAGIRENEVLIGAAGPDATSSKDVPVAIEQVRTEEDRQVMELVLGFNQFFRAFSTPPGVPADRLAALREAFQRTVADPAFVKEFTAASPIDFSTPRQIEDSIDRVYKFPPNAIKRASKFVAS